MQLRNWIILMVFLGITGTTTAFVLDHFRTSQNNTAPKEFPEYKELWEEVASLESDGLYRKALSKVEDILKKALTEKNDPQVVKAFFYKMKFANWLEEEDYVTSIASLEKVKDRTEEPLRQITHSLIGLIYWHYYQQNRWSIYERSESTDMKEEDIRTLDIKTLVSRINEHFDASLENPELLQSVALSDYEAIITPDSADFSLRPTLYDLLADRALTYFATSDSWWGTPQDAQTTRRRDLFKSAAKYISLSIPITDSSAIGSNKVLNLFKDAVAFHLDDKDPKALIEYDLQRINYIYMLSTLPKEEKDSLYTSALRNLISEHKDHPHSARVTFDLVNYYKKNGGDRWNANQDDATNSFLRTAHTLANECLKRFPKAIWAKNLRPIIQDIESKDLSVTVETLIAPETPMRAEINVRNIDETYIHVIPIPDAYFHATMWRMGDPEMDIVEDLKSRDILRTVKKQVRNTEDFRWHDKEVLLEGLPIGHYALVISEKSSLKSSKYVHVTNFHVNTMALIHRSAKDELEFFITDPTTGKARENVRITLMQSKYNQRTKEYELHDLSKKVTDENGIAQLSSVDAYYNLIVKLEDTKTGEVYMPDRTVYSYGYYDREETSQVYFFTDRGIYRPGQTIHFKGIAVKNPGTQDPSIMTNKKLTVRLYDPNYEEVEELSVTTNEFGSMTGTFSIPLGRLTGQYYIECDEVDGAQYVSVEEYKRPKFELEAEPLKAVYQLNDEVTVTGLAKGFAGNAVDGAKVSYMVRRNVSFSSWRSYSYYDNSKVLLEGDTVTDINGRYHIPVVLEPDTTIPRENLPVFSYTVMVEVTDINGETHSSSHYLQAGYHTMNLSISMPEFQLIPEEAEYIKVHTNNLSGQPVSGQGSFSIQPIEQPAVVYRRSYWGNTEQHELTESEFRQKFPLDRYGNEISENELKRLPSLVDGTFNTREADSVLIDLTRLQPGKYVLVAQGTDSLGNKVDFERTFTLAAPADGATPVMKPLWVRQTDYTVQVGEDATFLVASGWEDVNVMVEIEKDVQVIERFWIRVNKSQKKVVIPWKDEYKGNYAVHFTTIRHARSYKESYTVYVNDPDRRLDVELSTFRDKMKPGSEEEWTVTIKGKDGDQVAAELLAGMYDASLDEFRSNYWSFSPFGSYYSQLYWNSDLNSSSHRRGSDRPDREYFPSRYPAFPELNTFGFYPYYPRSSTVFFGYRGGGSYDRRRYRSASGEINMEGSLGVAKSEVMLDAVADEAAPMAAAQTVATGGSVGGREERTASFDGARDRSISATRNGQGKDAQVQIRKNLQETAFFLPQLRTDKDGNVQVNFTVPEALTKWKFMSMAHTKDLRIGSLTEHSVTQKELMVITNLPRFLREDDEMYLSAKISSLVDKELKGTAEIEILDAYTMTSLNKAFGITKAEQKFELDKKGSAPVSWQVKVPEGKDAVVVRIIARSGNFSDGEENTVPVLPNRVLVTETLPLTVKKAGTTRFTFESMNSNTSSTARNYRYTVEFSSNPAWYAVQAMPYMMEYPHECNEQVFTRFYSNALATMVVNNSPGIKRVFDTWRKEDANALLSNLEKNQELKALMLEETPWVMEAKDESQRKKRVALLFDLNHMANQMDRNLRKLAEGQNYGGGWPWFAGMPESRYITTHIVSGLGHLRSLGALSGKHEDKVMDMAEKAIAYLDQEFIRSFQQMKRAFPNYKDEQHLSNRQIQYLYARSFFNDKFDRSEDLLEAEEYYREQMGKYWLSFSLQLQGMIGLYAHRSDMKALVEKIGASLQDRAIRTEEMGMYWKDVSPSYWWYRAPVETQSILIEFFHEALKAEDDVDEMRIWLLRQKQTNDWKTTRATTEACYALLMGGETNFLAWNEQPIIQVGEHNVTELLTESPEAGTGYFKYAWMNESISKEMAEISVTREEKGFSWGAAYWQYFEMPEKLEQQGEGLSIEKKMYKVTRRNGEELLVPLDEAGGLKAGDRIRHRLILRADRKFEYVHMKDLRAAGTEPTQVFSYYHYDDGLGYYMSTRDASTNFFIEYVPKGSYVLEYDLVVEHAGDYTNGLCTVQCMYAPEFAAHSSGSRMTVEKE